MKPEGRLSVTDRYKLRELRLEQAGTVPAGRVMFCQGRKILAYADVAKLADVMAIPRGADTICVGPADFADVKEWVG